MSFWPGRTEKNALKNAPCGLCCPKRTPTSYPYAVLRGFLNPMNVNFRSYRCFFSRPWLHFVPERFYTPLTIHIPTLIRDRRLPCPLPFYLCSVDLLTCAINPLPKIHLVLINVVYPDTHWSGRMSKHSPLRLIYSMAQALGTFLERMGPSSCVSSHNNEKTKSALSSDRNLGTRWSYSRH